MTPRNHGCYGGPPHADGPILDAESRRIEPPDAIAEKLRTFTKSFLSKVWRYSVCRARHVEFTLLVGSMNSVEDAIPQERLTVDRFETYPVATFLARQLLLKLELFPNNGDDRNDTLALDLKLAQ